MPGSSPASSTVGPRPRFSMPTKQSASRSRETSLAYHLRHPGYQVIDAACNGLSPEVERLDAVGEAARAAAGQLAYALDVEPAMLRRPELRLLWATIRSPIIAYDGEQAPTPTPMGTFTSTTVPGCRVPHRLDRRATLSLYDAMGPDYTLLRLRPHGAGRRHRGGGCAGAVFRFAVLDVKIARVLRASESFYRHKLVLVRPDQRHVAWRGDAEPARCAYSISSISPTGRRADVDGKNRRERRSIFFDEAARRDARASTKRPRALMEATLEHVCPLPMKADCAGISIISCRLILLRVILVAVGYRHAPSDVRYSSDSDLKSLRALLKRRAKSRPRQTRC